MIPVERSYPRPKIDAFEAGYVLGLLVGEGHFGGDGRQPHIVLRMHVRHERIFRWLKERFPYAKLYGPYHHNDRHYYQLMWRGTQLKYGIMPWLEATPWADLDPHSYGRYCAMKERYGLRDVPDYARPEYSGLFLDYDPMDDEEAIRIEDAEPMPTHLGEDAEGNEALDT